MLVNKLHPLLAIVLDHTIVRQIAFLSKVSKTNKLFNVKLENITFGLSINNLESKHYFCLLLNKNCTHIWLCMLELVLKLVDPLFLLLANLQGLANINTVHLCNLKSGL